MNQSTLADLKGSSQHVCKFIVHGGEVCCGVCGIVSEERTEELYAELSAEMTKESAAEDHYISNTSLLNANGSQNAFISYGNKGLCFELGNPRGKDVHKKNIKTPVLKDGYATGQYMDRNGTISEKQDGKMKFTFDYNCDRWVRDQKVSLHQRLVELDLDIHEQVAAAKYLKKLQSTVVLDILTKLLPLMAICDGMKGRHLDDPKRVIVEKRLNEAKERLRVAIVGCQGAVMEHPPLLVR